MNDRNSSLIELNDIRSASKEVWNLDGIATYTIHIQWSSGASHSLVYDSETMRDEQLQYMASK